MSSNPTTPRYAVGDIITHFERQSRYRIDATPLTFKLRGREGGWERGYFYTNLVTGEQFGRVQDIVEDTTKYGPG
jgi:hypothetical protein